MAFTVSMEQDLLDQLRNQCRDCPEDEERILNGLAEFYREFSSDNPRRQSEPYPPIPGARFAVFREYRLIFIFRVEEKRSRILIGNVIVAHGMPDA